MMSFPLGLSAGVDEPRQTRINSDSRRFLGRAVLAAVFGFLVLVGLSLRADAQLLEVNSLADNENSGDGRCTLREAIGNANADDDLSDGDCIGGSGLDTILFTTGPGTIEVASSLSVREDITLIGPLGGGITLKGFAGFTLPILWTSGSSTDLVLERVNIQISSGPCVRLQFGASAHVESSDLFCTESVDMDSGSSLTVEGSSLGGTRGIHVRAFDNETTSINVTDSSVGGAIFGMLILASDDADVDLEIRDTTLIGSTGLFVDAVDDSLVSAEIFDSVVDTSNNGIVLAARTGVISARMERTAVNGASRGISVSGLSGTAFVTIVDSTIEGSSDAGIRKSNPGSVLVFNSTISGNTHGVDNLSDAGSISLIHNTITDNDVGIFTESNAALTEIGRTILGGNDVDCSGEAPDSLGHNVIGVNCGVTSAAGDLIGTASSPVDPGVEPLSDNGGPTETHRLDEDSPAVDRFASCPNGRDQRGVARPIGDGCDSGSYELEDLVPPDLTVPKDVTEEATGPDGAQVDYEATATDNRDPAPDVSCEPISGSLFPLGTTTVTCTAVDFSGNRSVAKFKVTVQDTTPPQIQVPADIVLEATGPSGAEATYTATAADIVDPNPSVVCNPASGSVFPLGTTRVTCSATDFNANQSAATFDVTVQDTIPPTLTLIGDAEIEVIEGNPYEDPGATAFDIVDGDITLQIVVTDPVDTSVPGIYTVSYDVTDNAGNSAETLTRTVVVISQQEAAENLAETVEELDVSASVQTTLTRLMSIAAGILGDDSEENDSASRSLVDQFINLVNIHLANGELTEDQAALLISEAEELQSALSG